MPQLSQQDSRSSEEISTLTLALVWMHRRSDMASAAPKACGQRNQENATGEHAESWRCGPSLHWVTAQRVFLKQQPVFTLLPSRIHRSPGPWSPSEWDSWATVLCCQTLLVNSLLQHTEPCQRKQSYSLLVCYYHKHLQHEHTQSTSSFYRVKVGARNFSTAAFSFMWIQMYAELA